ncbi:hypothetical protein DPMN_054862 [Dreissena polymorpha]|uniref:Roc domain-containing protein n=1 Tax=Dreissena polymorpha TaxID=45954 RepID=A0A9D4CNW3_DREPO|nr:hypothetical protein DPMN_054862 [Dreissena polymorpha]
MVVAGIKRVIDLILEIRDTGGAGRFLVPGTSNEECLRTVAQTNSKSDLDSRTSIGHINRTMETDTPGEASTTTEARIIQSPSGLNTQEPLVSQRRSLKRQFQCLESECPVTPNLKAIKPEQSVTESPNSVNSTETVPEHLLERPLQYLEEGGNTICRINHECMAIYLRCPNLLNVINLCEDVLNGKVEALFLPLQDYLRTLPDCNNISVVVAISGNDFTKCIMPCLIKLNGQSNSRFLQLEYPYKQNNKASTAAGNTDMKTAISMLKDLIDHHPSVNCETPPELRLTVDTLGVEDSHTLTRHLVDAANELQRHKKNATYRETLQPTDQHENIGIQTAISIFNELKGQIPVIDETSELRLKVEVIGVKDGHSLTRQIFDAAIELQSLEETKTSISQELRQYLQHVFQYLKKGGNALNIRETDCSAFYICCPTLANAMTLCEDFITGKVDALFQPLQGYLKTLPECQDLSIVVDISENDFVNCMLPCLTAIKRHLDSCVPAQGPDSRGSVAVSNYADKGIESGTSNKRDSSFEGPSSVHPWDRLITHLCEEFSVEDSDFENFLLGSKTRIGDDNYNRIKSLDGRSVQKYHAFFDCLEKKFGQHDSVEFLIHLTATLNFHSDLACVTYRTTFEQYKQDIEELHLTTNCLVMEPSCKIVDILQKRPEENCFSSERHPKGGAATGHHQEDLEELDANANVLVQTLQLLNDKIKDQDDKSLLKEIVSRIAYESVREKKYYLFKEYTRLFKDRPGFWGNISINATEDIFNILVEIWENPKFATYVMRKVYNEDISVIPIEKEISNKLPKDVQQLDDKAMTIFNKALELSKEVVKNIRLSVVGMFGVGKTSLVNNLIWDYRYKNKNKTLSTEGIAIHRCKLMTDGDWCLDTELKGVKLGGRIQKVVCKNTLSETSANYETASSHDLLVERVTSTEDHETFKERIALHKGDKILQEGIKVTKEMLETTSDNSEKSKASLDQSKNEITVSVWDFAGQSLYYSTHQFFLNERSIYVVVMDMTRSLKDVLSKSDGIGICCGLVDSCTYLDVFKFWLNAIHMNSDYQSGKRTIQPTVILVGTRKDEMKGSAEEKEKSMNLYFDIALCSFDRHSPILNHIYKNRFLVNNLSPKDSAFAELRKEIISLAAKQDYWNEEYPVRWIYMEHTLDKMRDEKRQIVKMKDVEKENLENILPLGEEELISFLELQHNQGNIIFFNSGELKDIVVLDPRWIIEAFKCFIPHTQKIEATVLKDWEEYKKYAILKPNVLYEVMKNSPPYIHEYQSAVINYMEYQNVIVKPLTSENGLTGIPLDFHIVPCLLRRAPPPLHIFTSPPDKPQTPVLAFVFCGKFMPPSLFYRLVAVCIRAWPISNEHGQYCLFNGLAIFTLNETCTLRIWYIDHIIYARIVCWSKNEKLDNFIWLFQEVRRKLKKSLLYFVHQSSSVFEECIQCPDLKESLHSQGLFIVKQFKYKNAIVCPVCNPHAVTRSNAMKHWFKERLDRIETDDE